MDFLKQVDQIEICRCNKKTPFVLPRAILNKDSYPYSVDFLLDSSGYVYWVSNAFCSSGISWCFPIQMLINSEPALYDIEKENMPLKKKQQDYIKSLVCTKKNPPTFFKGWKDTYHLAIGFSILMSRLGCRYHVDPIQFILCNANLIWCISVVYKQLSLSIRE